jgi:hypothetical protein
VVGFADQRLAVCQACDRELQGRLDRQDKLESDKLAYERGMGLLSQEMKLSEMLQRGEGKLSQLVAMFCQLRVARRLDELENKLKEQNRGQRLLP